MELLIGFVIFIGALIVCITLGYSTVFALCVGLIIFSVCAIRQGFSIKSLSIMAVNAIKDAVIVIEVMLIIGFITSVWRASGTISFFVFYGIKLITPGLFLVITFLLSCLLAYALGTSFGVAGTVGVIFIALARSGGVNPIITGAVVMSGIYFGDRGSPVSSSAILVANITKTNLLKNVKLMMKTGIIPLLITLGIYFVLSINNPIKEVDQSFIEALQNEFVISWWCIIPAICMLVLPLLKVPVIYAMLLSIASGMIVSIFVEKISVVALLKAMIFGYESTGSLGSIINGGGLVTMIEVVFIITISTTYSGIFEGTKMLEGIHNNMQKLSNKIGRFPTMVLMSLLTLGVFCNQTIATMMCNDIMKKPYIDSGASKEELAIDMENSVILLAGIVPWNIACAVPLAFMQIGYAAVPLSFFLYLVPFCYGIHKKVANPFHQE